LAKTPDKILRAALTDGRVHPKMSRKDAIALRKPPKEDVDTGDSESPTLSTSSDPVAAAVKAINALTPTELRDCLERISDDCKRALKQHYTGGRSDTAVMVKIADCVDAITGLLNHPAPKEPDKDRAKIHTYLVRINQLAGHGDKASQVSDTASAISKDDISKARAALDQIAIARTHDTGKAGQPGSKFTTVNMLQTGVDADGNPHYA
jgi:hypothetical protein